MEQNKSTSPIPVPVPTGLPPVPQKTKPRIPQSYLSYHFSYALPNFISTRPKHISATLENFNILGLLANLFVPFRRLTLDRKTTIFDRISFNLISIFIGASTRLALAISGILVTAIVAVLDCIAIVFYIIPVFSYPQFLDSQNKIFTNRDLANSQTFMTKLRKMPFFQTLFLFFDSDFINVFSSLPDPKTLGIKSGQTQFETFSIIEKSWQPFSKYLSTKNIKKTDFELLTAFLDSYFAKKPAAKPTPLGAMLTYGYTNTLDKFSKELTAQSFGKSIENKVLLSKIEKVLLRPQNNNVLLVGESGVGKHSTLYSLSGAIARAEMPNLIAKRVILLDTIALLGFSKSLPEIKANFETLLEEAKHAGNIILAIDEIDRLATPREGRMDLTEVLNDTLTDNSLPVIGITTTDEYNEYIRPNTTFLSLFEKINVEEPNREETIDILIGKALDIYKINSIATTFSSILEIVEKTESLMSDRRQPEKSIMLLEDAAGLAHAKKQKVVDLDLVDQVISEKTKTPVGKLTESEAQKLKDLEGFLHKRVIGQEEAIIEISKAMRRSRTEIEKRIKPMGSFLFLGPTGVGKTETAKALADAYFGSDQKMVRLDMSEFQDSTAIPRLIGNAQNKNQGQLANLIHEHPFGLLLLDEFEKSNRDVQNLFLQVLDEGKLTDAFGKKISFTNIIIIATSNAGAEFIREEVTKNQTTDLSKRLVDFVLAQGLFSPELVNRFDGVIVYHPLTQNEVIQVSSLLLQRLSSGLSETKNIKLEITTQLAQIVAEKGYDPAFGARPIQHLIADKIEDGIAKMLIAGKVANGETIPAATLLNFLK